MIKNCWISWRLKVSLSALLAVSALISLQPEAFTVGQLSGSGRVSGALSLSGTGFSGITGGAPLGARTSSVAGSQGTELLEFGNLAIGSGEGVSGYVTFALRGNSNYKLNMSVLNYNAVNLAFRGRDVSNAGDRGSFVNVRVGNITGSGARANAARSFVAGGMQGGVSLNQLSAGPVTAESTPIAQGDQPSLGGNASSPDNAVQIPVYFTVPSGLQLGPATGNPNANFQVMLQIGAFGGR